MLVPFGREPLSVPGAAHVALLAVLVMAPVATLPRAVSAQFPAELTGQLVDAGTRGPILGARVEVRAAGLVTTADDAGRFRLRGLSAGTWEIDAAAIGYGPAHVVTRLVDGQVERMVIALVAIRVVLDSITVTASAPMQDAGTSVIDRAAVDASLAPDIVSLLANQPGLVVTQRGGPGSSATVSIRGGAARQVLVLVDGAPLNDPTSGEADLSLISLAQIERITIIRGSASARYGARALAGVVLVERRRPTDSEAAVTVAAGSWGERTTRATLGLAGHRGSHPLSASLSGQLARASGDFQYGQPDVRGGGVAERLNSGGRTASLLGAVRLGGRQSFLELRGDLLGADRGLPGSIVQPTVQARQAEQRLGADLALHRTVGAVEWEAQAQIVRQRVRYADPAPPAGPPYDDSIAVRQTRVALTGSRGFGAMGVIAGGELRRIDLESSTLAASAPHRQQTVGAWLESRAERAFPRARAALTGGVRLDHDDSGDGPYVSPTLGAQLNAHGVTLQLRWGTAFAPPTISDQFFQPGVLARPNPNLGPERIRSEVQAQLGFADLRIGRIRGNADVAVFRSDVDGAILWFPDFRFVWSPGNYDVRRRGAELSTTLAFPMAGLVLAGSVSQVAVDYRGPVLSGQVAYRPRTTANGSLEAAFAGVRGTARYRYIGQRRTVPGSDLNTLDAYGVLDLQLARRLPGLRPELELTVGLDDVFDRAPAMLVDYPSPGRTWRVALSLRSGAAAARTH